MCVKVIASVITRLPIGRIKAKIPSVSAPKKEKIVTKKYQKQNGGYLK